MMNYFVFNGVNSNTYNLIISNKKVHSSPKRSQEIISVPGRDGDIIFDNGSFENVSISYTCSLLASNGNLTAIKAWLLSSGGYKRLEDSFDTNCYRLACLDSTVEISEQDSKLFTLEIKFTCKPFKYLKSGETAINIDFASPLSSYNISNNTQFSSLPLIKIKASKEITLHISNGSVTTDKVITFPNYSMGLTIDSELMAVYRTSNSELYNSAIDWSDFPRLLPGNNSIGFTLGTGASITEASIIPRWRTL